MSKLKVGVVYSLAQKQRRRTIVLNHHNANIYDLIPHRNLVGPGEGWLEVDHDLYHTFKDGDLDKHIAGILGPATSHRHVIVGHDSTVVHVFYGDIFCDMLYGKHRNTEYEEKFGGMQVIQHDEAHVGHVYKNGKFKAPGAK